MAALEQATVLVTGATGFIGSHLLDRLVERQCRVKCLVRRGGLPARPGIEWVRGDLAADEGLREAVAGVSVVIHLAGITKAHTPEQFYRGNVLATENLLRACHASPNPPEQFVHVSSLAAIGPSPDGVPLAEDAPPRPLTHYGKSKLKAEAAVRASDLAARVVIVRPPVVYGPRDTDVFEILRAVSRGVMPIIGRQEQFFSYIYAKDLAEALLAAAECAAARGNTYFVANPEPVSWREFGIAAAKIMGRQLKFLSMPPALAYAAAYLAELASYARGKAGIFSREKVREARCRFWSCDSSRAGRELGFQPRWTLAAGLSETLAWYKDAGWLKY